MKYSGLAFQMVAVICISYFIGNKIDTFVGNEKPYFVMLLIFTIFIAYLYKLYKELNDE
jgi:Na+/glutamate symporter